MPVVKYVNTSGIVRIVTTEVVWVLSSGDELVLSRGSDGYGRCSRGRVVFGVRDGVEAAIGQDVAIADGRRRLGRGSGGGLRSCQWRLWCIDRCYRGTREGRGGVGLVGSRRGRSEKSSSCQFVSLVVLQTRQNHFRWRFEIAT